jgi:hypothetical protein
VVVEEEEGLDQIAKGRTTKEEVEVFGIGSMTTRGEEEVLEVIDAKMVTEEIEMMET